MTTGDIRQEARRGLTPEDREEIKQVCLDFLEGWYTGDAERVARSLHPELIKRSVMPDPDREWILRQSVTQEQMVQWAREGGGSEVPRDQVHFEITIHDGFRHIATASALSPEYMDFLHLARVDGRWIIVNDLWELRQGSLGG